MSCRINEKCTTQLNEMVYNAQKRHSYQCETALAYEKSQAMTGYHQLQIYDDILQEVVDQMDIFESKEDLLDRCEAILLAQNEVAQSDEMSLKAIEKMQASIVKISNDGASMMAGFENEMTQLEKEVDKAKKEYLKLESIQASGKDVITDKEKEMFMMFDQIQQLYLLLCERSGTEPIFKRDQVEEQLDFIKREIEIWREILAMAEEMTALENRSDIAEHGSGISGKPRK